MRQIIFTQVIFSGSIIFLLFLSIGNLKAQDSTQFKKNEVWVDIINSNGSYKRALNSKTFIKASLYFNFKKSGSESITEGDYFSDLNSNDKSNGGDVDKSIRIGIEKRSSLFSKITLFHGPDLFYGFSNNKSKYHQNYQDYNDYSRERKQSNQRFGVSYTIGAIYSFNSFLALGISWTPNLYYSIIKTQVSTYYYDDNSTSQTQRKNNSLNLTLASTNINLILKF